MIRAFWFVTTRSFKNRILMRLRRLREPRYLISFIAGLAYLWFMFLRRLVFHTGRRNIVGFSLPVTAIAVDGMSVFVLVAMILAWALPEQSGGLTFSQAEIQFLFPAPISRRQLLIYKFFRQLPPIFISAFMMTLFGFWQAKFIGLLIPFVFLSVYFTMVGLARARLKLMGIGFLARLVIVGLVLTGLGMLFASALHTTPAFSSAELRTGPTVLKALESRLHAPAIRTILFVPRLFAMAALPESFAQQVLVCLALLGIGALFLAAAAQLNVSFEEASLHASERQIARLERRRGQRTGRRVMFKRMPPPFRLVPSQHPEIAILWKNLTAALRISGAFIFFIAFILILFVVPNILTHESYLKGVGATMALCFAALFPLAASQLFAQDMRLDVPDMELLKSYPISGERLIAAEISAPLIMMSIIQIVLLSIAALMVHASHPNGSLAFFGTAQFVVVALLFTLPICATQLVIRNAIVVLLPGWSVRSGEDQRGFAVIGQRLVTLGGNLIVLAIALLPAAALFVPALLVSRAWFAGSAAVLAVATVPSVALLCWEVWMAIKFLGAQFDRVDVTTEIGIATL